jgi:hypothetical protein
MTGNKIYISGYFISYCLWFNPKKYFPGFIIRSYIIRMRSYPLAEPPAIPDSLTEDCDDE